MVCSSIGRDLGLGFLYIVTRAMGCFFGCFRAKENRRSPPHLVSDPVLPKHLNQEAVISGNRLSYLFLSDENEGSPHKGHARGYLQPGTNNDMELKDEAKFLKACGTLLETPAEIRKVLKHSECSLPPDGESGRSKFHSWLPNMSIEKFDISEQPEHLSTPAKPCENRGMASSSCEETPNSCVSDVNDTRRVITSSYEGSGLRDNLAMKVHVDQTNKVSVSLASPSPAAANLQSRNKSVRFECEHSMLSDSSSSSSPGSVSEHSKRNRPVDNHSVSMPSPYPTPLKLSDEMQTPGTVFASNLEKLGNGKNTRIRSQYVYSVLNPIENYSQWKVLKGEDSDSNQLSGQERDPFEQRELTTPKTEVRESENSQPKELNVEASLSAWLKPPPSSRRGKDQCLGAVSSKNPPFGRTPGDRPILGTVATHWNEDELPHVSPKWWDGNGIPNSTTKYKEDQKVSWHATPFEERLEKALSEENVVPPRRRHSRTPLVFDENEECDTAISQIKSPAQSKSVVSF